MWSKRRNIWRIRKKIIIERRYFMTVKDYADMVVSMDADLQDDINAVDGMVEKYKYLLIWSFQFMERMK